MKKNTYRFTIPILEARVLVSFEDSHHDGGKDLSKFLKKDVDCSASVACVDSESNRIGVWIGKDAKNKTVVHECHHVLKESYEWMGAKLGGDEELDASFLEFISGKILDAWDKHREAKKKKIDESRLKVI